MDLKIYKKWLNEQAKANFGLFKYQNFLVLVDLELLRIAYEKIKSNPNSDKKSRFEDVYNSGAVVSMLDVRPIGKGVSEIRSSFTKEGSRGQGHSEFLRKYALTKSKFLTTDPESETEDEKKAWARFVNNLGDSKKKELEDGRMAVSASVKDEFSPAENAFKDKVEEIANMFGDKASFMKQDIPLILSQVAEKSFRTSMGESILAESKLSGYWKKRAKNRAIRAKRAYPNKIDRMWALKEQEKSSIIDSKFKALYEDEIEMTEELTTTIDEFLEKVKQEKIAMEAKKNSVGAVKFGPGTPEKSKKSISVPMKPEYGGVRKGFERNLKKLKKGMKGSVGISPGSSYGGIAEEVNKKVKLPIIENATLQKNTKDTLKRISSEHVGYMEIDAQANGFACGDCRSLNEESFCENPEVKAYVSARHGCCNHFYSETAKVIFPKEEKGDGDNN
jgi:FKBP-type peptidyl-prolyl cis-trans isomerase 2